MSAHKMPKTFVRQFILTQNLDVHECPRHQHWDQEDHDGYHDNAAEVAEKHVRIVYFDVGENSDLLTRSPSVEYPVVEEHNYNHDAREHASTAVQDEEHLPPQRKSVDQLAPRHWVECEGEIVVEGILALVFFIYWMWEIKTTVNYRYIYSKSSFNEIYLIYACTYLNYL